MGPTPGDSHFTGLSSSRASVGLRSPPPPRPRRSTKCNWYFTRVLPRGPLFHSVVLRPAAAAFGNLYNLQILGSQPDLWNKNSNLCFNRLPIDSDAYSSLGISALVVCIKEPQSSLHPGGRREREFAGAQLLFNYPGLAMTSQSLGNIVTRTQLEAQRTGKWDPGWAACPA